MRPWLKMPTPDSKVALDLSALRVAPPCLPDKSMSREAGLFARWRRALLPRFSAAFPASISSFPIVHLYSYAFLYSFAYDRQALLTQQFPTSSSSR